MSEKPNILVVDDDNLVRDLVCEGLGAEGYSCTPARDGSSALESLKKARYDVTLLDLMLPDIPGRDILVTASRTSRVIVITGVYDLETAIGLMRLGAADYIVKPFSLNRVQASIDSCLQQSAAHDGEAFMKPGGCLEAISRGVAARLDTLFGYSREIIEQTLDIARRLSVPDSEIQAWLDARQCTAARQKLALDRSVRKLEDNPVAQSLMGLTRPHDCSVGRRQN